MQVGGQNRRVRLVGKGILKKGRYSEFYESTVYLWSTPGDECVSRTRKEMSGIKKFKLC